MADNKELGRIHIAADGVNIAADSSLVEDEQQHGQHQNRNYRNHIQAENRIALCAELNREQGAAQEAEYRRRHITRLTGQIHRLPEMALAIP